jgi:hypothetical protein
MKRLINYSVIVLVLTVFAGSIFAQSDKSVKQNKAQEKVKKETQTQWVDKDGDGICDNSGTVNQGQGRKGNNSAKGKKNGNMSGKNGYGDGSGIRPQDGTGFGKGNGSGKGTGNCDGTGPKGKGQKGKTK